MKTKNDLIYIIILVLVIGIMVFAGIKFLKTSKTNSETATNSGVENNNSNRQAWDNGNRNGNFQRGNFKPLHGSIVSISGNTISMKADDGSTKTINVTSATRITKEVNNERTTLQLSGIKADDEITVMGGDPTSDTSASTIDARMIFVGTFTMPQRGSGNGSGNQPPSNQTNNSPDGSI